MRKPRLAKKIRLPFYLFSSLVSLRLKIKLQGTVQNLGFGLPMPIFGVEQRQARSAAQPGTGRAILDGAAALQQEAGAGSCPSHLLGFIHSPGDEEIRGRFGERFSNT